MCKILSFITEYAFQKEAILNDFLNMVFISCDKLHRQNLNFC